MEDLDAFLLEKKINLGELFTLHPDGFKKALMDFADETVLKPDINMAQVRDNS